MKLYSMNSLTRKIPSRYMLVNVVAHRARQIASAAEGEDAEPLTEKPVTIALEQVANGELEIVEES